MMQGRATVRNRAMARARALRAEALRVEARLPSATPIEARRLRVQIDELRRDVGDRVFQARDANRWWRYWRMCQARIEAIVAGRDPEALPKPVVPPTAGERIRARAGL